MSGQGQNFASVATIRAALFDVMDQGCTCYEGETHPWEIDGADGDDDDKVDQRRTWFVDTVIKRLAELQSPPHGGIKLENLCPRHRREALPVPTAKVCVMCESERKVVNRGRRQEETETH